MIVRFDYEKSPEHIAEMAACAQMVEDESRWHTDTLDSYSSLEQFYKNYFSSVNGEEFARATECFRGGPPLRILDVGAGRGETSLYLVDQGHHVFPVEPSLDFCKVIDRMGTRFGKNLTIYNCSAEALDLPGEQFDVVSFNISLHHCDDPAGALKNMYRFLRPGGKLFVISEPMLPFYKTAAGVLKKMNASPAEFGHYGGNEHVYHFAEYVSMIKQAGYRDLRRDLVSRYRSKHSIAESLATDPRHSRLRKKIKNWYLNSVYLLEQVRLKPLLAILEQLSLLQVTFTASK